MPTTLKTRPAGRADIAAISRLHARVFGPGRFARSAYRVREGKGQVSRLCLVSERGGVLIGSVRMTEITIGGRAGGALLGPVAIEPEYRGQGLGTTLIEQAMAAARSAGVELVILVGDEPYYGRFGFKPVPTGQIVFPGPVNPARVLATELEAGALGRYCGVVAAVPTAALSAEDSIAAQV